MPVEKVKHFGYLFISFIYCIVYSHIAILIMEYKYTTMDNYPSNGVTFTNLLLDEDEVYAQLFCSARHISVMATILCCRG